MFNLGIDPPQFVYPVTLEHSGEYLEPDTGIPARSSVEAYKVHNKLGQVRLDNRPNVHKSKLDAMPLEDTCERYRGKTLFVLPAAGYGWCQVAPGNPRYQPGNPAEPPPPFHARVADFVRFLTKIRAGIAVVEEHDHPLDKQWLAFCVRDGMGSSTHNLTTTPAEYNVRIGNERPAIKIDPENLAMPEWMQFEHSECLNGLGYIVESRSLLDEILGRMKTARLVGRMNP